jgi:hypothetical protein
LHQYVYCHILLNVCCTTAAWIVTFDNYINFTMYILLNVSSVNYNVILSGLALEGWMNDL